MIGVYSGIQYFCLLKAYAATKSMQGERGDGHDAETAKLYQQQNDHLTEYRELGPGVVYGETCDAGGGAHGSAVGVAGQYRPPQGTPCGAPARAVRHPRGVKAALIHAVPGDFSTTIRSPASR